MHLIYWCMVIGATALTIPWIVCFVKDRHPALFMWLAFEISLIALSVYMYGVIFWGWGIKLV